MNFMKKMLLRLLAAATMTGALAGLSASRAYAVASCSAYTYSNTLNAWTVYPGNEVDYGGNIADGPELRIIPYVSIWPTVNVNGQCSMYVAVNFKYQNNSGNSPLYIHSARLRWWYNGIFGGTLQGGSGCAPCSNVQYYNAQPPPSNNWTAWGWSDTYIFVTGALNLSQQIGFDNLGTTIDGEYYGYTGIVQNNQAAPYANYNCAAGATSC